MDAQKLWTIQNSCESFSTFELGMMITKGTIQGNVLVFNEKIRDWRPLDSWPELMQFRIWRDEEINQIEVHSAKPEWIVFSEQVMDGPYSTKFLRDQILSGKYSQTSLFWKSGYLDWKKMSEIPEFIGV